MATATKLEGFHLHVRVLRIFSLCQKYSLMRPLIVQFSIWTDEPKVTVAELDQIKYIIARRHK